MIAHLAATAASNIDDITVEIPDAIGWLTKILIALFLFGVALEVRVDDVREAVRRPFVFVVCLGMQFVLIPALTLALIALLDVRASVALGLMLVVCLPAGNLSNILTYRARADVPLSVSLTTASNALAVVLTPVALAFWGSLSPRVADILADVEISSSEAAVDVGLMILLPFAAGIVVVHRFPALAQRARTYVEPAVLVVISLLVVGAVAANLSSVVDHVLLVGIPVVAANLMSLVVGYAGASACRLPVPSRRAMTLEMGIRNTSLGLVLALAFFPSAGGVAVTLALYGFWDMVTGFALATWWRRRAPAELATVSR